MAYCRDVTSTSQLKQMLIVTPGYIYIYIYIHIYIYVPRFVAVCFTMIHNAEDFEKGKPKI